MHPNSSKGAILEQEWSHSMILKFSCGDLFLLHFCTPCFQRKLLALKKLKDLLEFQQKQIFCSRKYTFWGLCPILGVPKIKSRLSDNDVFSCFPEWVVFPLFHIWIQFPEGSWIPGLVLLQLSPSAFRLEGETNPRIWRELDSTYFFWIFDLCIWLPAHLLSPSPQIHIPMKRFMDGTQLVSQQSTNEKVKQFPAPEIQRNRRFFCKHYVVFQNPNIILEYIWLFQKLIGALHKGLNYSWINECCMYANMQVMDQYEWCIYANKHCKNCEYCPVSLLIVSGSVDSGCHKLSGNMWLVWSKTSYSGDVTGTGRTNNQQGKIELIWERLSLAILNCLNCNQYLKCHKSLGLSLFLFWSLSLSSNLLGLIFLFALNLPIYLLPL